MKNTAPVEPEKCHSITGVWFVCEEPCGYRGFKFVATTGLSNSQSILGAPAGLALHLRPMM
jgi:hypothetical protein